MARSAILLRLTFRPIAVQSVQTELHKPIGLFIETRLHVPGIKRVRLLDDLCRIAAFPLIPIDPEVLMHLVPQTSDV